MTKKESKPKAIKYKENPFLDVFRVTTKGKRVSVTAIGGESNVLINQETGEIKGTHVSSYKQVDDEEFVKIFTANIAMTFELNAAGRKMFDMLLHVVQIEAISKDQIYIDELVREEFTIKHSVKLSSATMYRGLDNLMAKKILAKSTRTNIYFINPNLVFNGDRVVFSQAIERKQKRHNGDSHLQEPLELGE